MRKQVIDYVGLEVTPSIIDDIKNIAFSRYDQDIYKEYFSKVFSVLDLCKSHDVSLNDEHVVLGEDWFLAYSVSDEFVEILEWVAKDISYGKFAQVKEMMEVFKKLLLLCQERNISATFRHDSSYKFYQTALKKDYLYEVYDDAVIDCAISSEGEKLLTSLIDEYGTLEEVLYYEEEKVKKYHKYILHDVICGVTSDYLYKHSDL